MSLQPIAHQDDVERKLQLGKRVALEVIVRQAVELVEVHELDPFNAADLVTRFYGYNDFERVLNKLRAEVDR